jgi:hypothetical protein
MATLDKAFRVKSGLVVEGTDGTINGSDIITASKITSGTQSGIAVTYTPGPGANVNFNVNDPLITISGDVDGSATMTNLGDTNISVTLDTVNSNVGSFGGTTKIPTITINGKGLVTAAGEVDVATNLSIAGDTGTDTVSLLTDTLTFEGGNGITSTISNNKVKVDIDSTVATLTDQQTLTNKVLGTNVDLGADLDAATYKIVNLGTPTSTADAATKGYVDSVSQGLSIKEAVRVATTAAVTLSTGLENGDTLDGVTLATGNRILVKNQAAGSENGIYTVNATGAPTRAADANVSSEVTAGMFTFVSEGTVNGNTSWVLTTDNPITLDTTALEFTQFAGAGTFTAGVGLDLNGTEFVLDLSEVDTTTLPEGTNKYYTDERVDDRVAALVTGGKGITASYDDNGNLLTLSAEFTEFTTDDVVEGSTKLYFTNARAVTALEAVVPDFTAIEVNNLTKQVAATVSLPTINTETTIYQWPLSEYKSAKFLVKFAQQSHTELSEVLITTDTSGNVAITEYGIVGTNGNIGNITADVILVETVDTLRVRVTGAVAGATAWAAGTLIR